MVLRYDTETVIDKSIFFSMTDHEMSHLKEWRAEKKDNRLIWILSFASFKGNALESDRGEYGGRGLRAGILPVSFSE